MALIKTIGYKQDEMIKDIVDLHCGGHIDVDPTYSKGVFYKSGLVPQPTHKFDLFPQTEDTVKCAAENNLSVDNDPTTAVVGKTGEQINNG